MEGERKEKKREWRELVQKSKKRKKWMGTNEIGKKWGMEMERKMKNKIKVDDELREKKKKG